MQGVKRFAENMSLGYEASGEFYVPHPPDAMPTRHLRAHSAEHAPRPSRLSFGSSTLNARLLAPFRPSLAMAAKPSVACVTPSTLKPRCLGLHLGAQPMPIAIVARPIGWFQVKLTEVTSASQRCDTALRRAEAGLAAHVDDAKSLQSVLKAFREAKHAFYTANGVVAFREMKDLLQEAWVSAQARGVHQESFALHRAETDALIRDLSERIEQLHAYIMHQGQSLEAADEEIRALRQALGQMRNVDAQDAPAASPREDEARAMMNEPTYLTLKAHLKEEILEAFKQEFLLATAADTPRFARAGSKSGSSAQKDELHERFVQMRKLSEQRALKPAAPSEAASAMSFEWV